MRRRQRGYVLFSMAFLAVALCGFAALVFDVGYLQYYKRRAQTAADSGAMAAAVEVTAGNSVSTAVTAATQDVTTNGFTNGVNGATVTVNNPPLSGSHTGDSKYTEVIVSRSMPTIFMNLLNLASMSVSSRAVGGPGYNSACIYALAPTGASAFNVGGHAQVSSACGVLVNSSDPSALTETNSACLSATNIGVVGGYSISSSCGMTPTPQTGIPYFSDPLSTLQPPTVGACNYTNYQSSSNTIIFPGVYCGGIKVTGGTLFMWPGTYILLGGGLSVSGNASVSGNGVTFYNTGNSTYAYGPVSLNGSGTINLKAPTTGAYEGILFFADRTTGNGSSNIINGNSTSVIQGTLYFPTSNLTYNGNSSVSAYTMMVAWTLNFTGNTTVNDDYSTLSTGSPIKSPSIVE